MRLPILATLAALTFAGAAGSQNVPTRTLAKPDAEFSEPFTAIGNVRELSDGRVVVNDATEKTLQLLDFSSGKISAIGREGEGRRLRYRNGLPGQQRPGRSPIPAAVPDSVTPSG
jgi:hypothetical protein